MIEAQLNMFDAVVILVFMLSTVLAFFRGFVREVLSLGAWVGAAVITIYAFEPVAEMLKSHVSRNLVAYLIAGVGTYLATLLTISIINAFIIRYVKSGAEVGMLDNFLGLGFGALRGAFIVSLGYLVLTLVIDEDKTDWVKHAATRDIAKKGALVLSSIAPGYLEDISSLKESMEESDDEEEDTSSTTTSATTKPRESAGYSKGDRIMLDNLIGSRVDEQR